MPIAIGIALFITQYAPKRLAKPVAYLVDLLAAMPSIIYGIWGIIVLAPTSNRYRRPAVPPHFIPLFGRQERADRHDLQRRRRAGDHDPADHHRDLRDVFERTPTAHIEAALALGATRWEMIRMAVLPYGKPGVISGAMLGLGRALGETIAITLILSGKGNGHLQLVDLRRRRDVRVQDRAGRVGVQRAEADRRPTSSPASCFSC